MPVICLWPHSTDRSNAKFRTKAIMAHLTFAVFVFLIIFLPCLHHSFPVNVPIPDNIIISRMLNVLSIVVIEKSKAVASFKTENFTEKMKGS